MQQCIGGLDRSLATPIEHEAPSHRHLRPRKIAAALGRQVRPPARRRQSSSTRAGRPLRSSDGRRADGGKPHSSLAARNPGAPAGRPRTAPPAEPARAPPRSPPRGAVVPAPSRRASTKAVPRQFAEIARHGPCSSANASRAYDTVLPKSPIRSQYDARRVAAPEATEVVPSSNGPGTGAASAVSRQGKHLLECTFGEGGPGASQAQPRIACDDVLGKRHQPHLDGSQPSRRDHLIPVRRPGARTRRESPVPRSRG